MSTVKVYSDQTVNCLAGVVLISEKRNGTHQNFTCKAYAEKILANEYHSNILVTVASKGLKSL